MTVVVTVVVVVSVSARVPGGDVQRDERGVSRVVEEDAEGRADVGVEGVQGRERASERGEEGRAGVDAYGEDAGEADVEVVGDERVGVEGGIRGRVAADGAEGRGERDEGREASREPARGRRGMSTGMYTCVAKLPSTWGKARTRPLEVASSGGSSTRRGRFGSGGASRDAARDTGESSLS